ncbi:MAG TPA: LacI family DNA-binding transcriptional regulator [Dermatophilaceae bacterium]
MTARSERPQRATLVDVALAAQVSRQTVSNVLNNPGKVSPATLARVQTEIDRLKFLPNLSARALRQRKANALGIELNATGRRRLGNIQDSFLVELTITAREQDAHIITFAVEKHLEPESEYERLLATQMVSGFVLTNTRHEDPRPAWLRDHDVPFVSFGRVWDDPDFTAWADVDGKVGIAHGVRHLVERGYGPIGYLGWPHGSPVGDDRRAGWAAATSELGIHDPTLQEVLPQDLPDAAAVQSLIQRVGIGGAIVCASDTLALTAYQGVRDQGLQPGADIGLIGFDDTDTAQAFGLSSLRQPLAEIAHTLVAFLADAEAGGVAPAHGVVFDPVVIPRRSTERSSAAHAPVVTNPADNRSHDGDSS